MPCLTGRFNPAAGGRPIIMLGISPAGMVAAAQAAAAAAAAATAGSPGTVSNPTPTASVKTFAALIDTGADGTCISLTVTQALGLQPRGKRPMNSATHGGAAAVPVNWYLVDVVVPMDPHIALFGIQVLEWSSPPNSQFQILLGRDILCRGIFTMSFDGHFSFSI